MKNLSHVRIIGGKWRSRQIYFNADQPVRPTPDRVRETLFNWLMPMIKGANCLDLCAGSGALGFEALSRGANEVVMIDQSPPVIAQLQSNANRLQVDNITLIQQQLPATLNLPAQHFSIVFLDPPFKQGLVKLLSDWLATSPWLAPQALIYIETERELDKLPVPSTWQVYRQGQTRQINYYLLNICPKGSDHFA